MPPAFGLRAHVGLAKISGYIVANVYDISRQTTESTNLKHYIDESLKMLLAWRESLPDPIQMQDNDATQDRATCEIHMHYNQVNSDVVFSYM